jgi:hypothetical protein
MEEEKNLYEFGEEIYNVIDGVLNGIILADNVTKFETFCRDLSDLELDSICRVAWKEVCDTVANEDINKRLLASDGGWNILITQIGEMRDSWNDELRDAAVKSDDIAHYLLLKQVLNTKTWTDSVDENLAYKVFSCAPQNLGFYLGEFPKAIEELVETYLDGRFGIIKKLGNNRRGKDLFLTLLPHTRWNEELRAKVDKAKLYALR